MAPDRGSQAPPTQQACLECRLNKVKCRRSTGPCQRCQRYGFDCRFQQNKARGRKAKSKVSSTTADLKNSTTSSPASSLTTVPPPSHASAQAPPFLTDTALRRKVWQSLIAASVGRGSTYTFVSSGNADVTSLEKDSIDTGSSNRGEGQSSPPQTLRLLLRPLHRIRLDFRDDGTRTSRLPKAIYLDAVRDPRAAGIITKKRGEELLSYFYEYLSPWIAVLDTRMDISHAFLYSALLSVASRYHPRSSSAEIDALTSHARMLACLSFAQAETGQDVVLAFYLLSVWKDPDDSFSDLYNSYADRIILKQADSSNSSSAQDRHGQRITFFHFVQQCVYLLHYCPSPSLDIRSPLPRHALTWAQSDQALSGDWFLSADVESTAIQCRYKNLFEEQQRLYCHGTGTAFAISLLDAFLAEVDDWEHRWRREAQKQIYQNEQEKTIHLAGFGFFRNSVINQISSIALCAALRAWLTGTMPSCAATAVERSYQICLDSAIGVLNSSLSLQDQPEAILHMPDSLVILLSQASLLILYLLLVPAATAKEEGLTSNAPKGTISRGRLNEVEKITALCASDCMDKIRNVHTLTSAASALRPHLQTAVSLTAAYLGSLLHLVDGEPLSNEQETLLDASWTDAALSWPSNENVFGWDWLQNVLDPSFSILTGVSS